MDKVRADLIQTYRAIRARPSATAATVLVVGLGIGLTSAMFALADPFLLRPLPYADPDELVVIHLRAEFGVDQTPGQLGIPTLADWQARDDLFQSVSAHRTGPALRLRTPDRAVAVQTMEVSSNLFRVLGVSATDIASPVGSGQRERPLALTAGSHERLFGAGSVIGTTFLESNGGSVRVTSILPPEFLFPRARVNPLDALLFVDVAALADVERLSGMMESRPYTVIARLRRGVTPETAQAALTAALAHPKALTIRAQSLTHFMRRDSQPLAVGALLSGILILVVCAANLGNLLLARGAYRVREFATREAIGATRTDLARLILVELAVVTASGIAAGLALAHAALALTGSVIPAEYAALGTPAVTARVIAFACLMGTAVMSCGIVPSWTAWRTAPRTSIGAASAGEARGVRALRMFMAAAQCAIAVILLSGAALLLRSYINLTRQETGFARDLVVAAVSYPPAHLGPRLQSDIDGTLERFRRIPGVVAVGAATGSMVDDLLSQQMVRAAGRSAPVQRKYVSPGYFEAVGTAVISGRTLTPQDTRATAIVNESFATRYWPGGQAVGQQVILGIQPAEIVGVVRDTFDIALDRRPEPALFTILKDPALALRVNYVLRYATPDRAAPTTLAREVAAVNADAILINASVLEGRLMATVNDRIFATLVLTFFAVAGVGVCAAGLIGIVSFVVARRTREIAIRMALGATVSNIRRVVLGEAIGAAAAGAAAGVVAGRWLSRTAESLLYGVQPGDWPAVVLAVVVMMVVVSLAALLPVRSVTARSPWDVLRAE